MVATLNLLCQEIQTAARCLDGWIQNKGAVILLCVTVGRGRTTLMMEEPLGDCWHPAVSRSLTHTHAYTLRMGVSACFHTSECELNASSALRKVCVRVSEWVSEWEREIIHWGWGRSCFISVDTEGSGKQIHPNADWWPHDNCCFIQSTIDVLTSVLIHIFTYILHIHISQSLGLVIFNYFNSLIKAFFQSLYWSPRQHLFHHKYKKTILQNIITI